MRRRRHNKPKIASVESSFKKYNEPVLGITYQDESGGAKKVQIPFDGAYLDNASYRENFEDACYTICMDIGGFWINNKVVVPANRILNLFMIEDSAPFKNNQKPRENNHHKEKIDSKKEVV